MTHPSHLHLHPAGLQPLGMHGSTHPRGRTPREIRLGFPGYDPLRACLHLLVFDDSWSLASPTGNDPVAARYQEAERAIRHVANWTFSSRQRAAIAHFDHPAGFTGPQRLDTARGTAALAASLTTPPGAVGTSDLGPVLEAVHELARGHDGVDLSLTVLTDWMLTDADPAPVFDRLAAFPGPVHAVALNAAPPLDLDAMGNVTVTRVSSADPPGMLAATIAHSLTSTRRGRRRPALRTGTHRTGVRR